MDGETFVLTIAASLVALAVTGVFGAWVRLQTARREVLWAHSVFDKAHERGDVDAAAAVLHKAVEDYGRIARATPWFIRGNSIGIYERLAETMEETDLRLTRLMYPIEDLRFGWVRKRPDSEEAFERWDRNLERRGRLIGALVIVLVLLIAGLWAIFAAR